VIVEVVGDQHARAVDRHHHRGMTTRRPYSRIRNNRNAEGKSARYITSP
jgi:hypothetical protein